MKLSCDQYKKPLLKACQVNQQAFLRSAAQKEPILSNSMGQHSWKEHLVQLTLKHISHGHLVSPITQGGFRDLCATFLSLICPGREKAQTDVEKNLPSWFKKSLVPCSVCTCMCCTAGPLFSFKQPIKAYFGT